jgi:hypothetical protein
VTTAAFLRLAAGSGLQPVAGASEPASGDEALRLALREPAEREPVGRG